MNLNDIIFPAPESSFQYRSTENVIWIPRNSTEIGGLNALLVDLKIKSSSLQFGPSKKHSFIAPRHNATSSTTEGDFIPCLYLPYIGGSDKILIYFHGNAEDIGWAYDFAATIGEKLKVNVLSMEYPGYGLYIGEPSADKILQDAETVFDYLQYQIGVPSEDILLFGRSIGSGPATHLASRRNVGALLLMSPYTSIKAVAKEIAGAVGSLMVADRFRNIDEIKKVYAPTFFIHGQKDRLIPFSHTIELMNNCSGICGMNLPKNMTHDAYLLEDHLTKPIAAFLSKCEFEINLGKKFYEIPNELYKQPELLRGKKNRRTFISKMLDT